MLKWWETEQFTSWKILKSNFKNSRYRNYYFCICDLLRVINQCICVVSVTVLWKYFDIGVLKYRCVCVCVYLWTLFESSTAYWRPRTCLCVCVCALVRLYPYKVRSIQEIAALCFDNWRFVFFITQDRIFC